MEEETEGFVKCDYNSETFYITNEVLSEVLIRMQFRGRNLFTYEETAELYGMSSRKIRDLARKAGAVVKVDGRAFVDSTVMDDYIENKA